MATRVNSGTSASIASDLSGAPIAGDTVLLTQGAGQFVYDTGLNGLAAVDLAAFIAAPSSGASIGDGNDGLHVDAALVQLLGGGRAYSLRGGAAASQDRVEFGPRDAECVGRFAAADCADFAAWSGGVVTLTADYEAADLYLSGTLRRCVLEAVSGVAEPARVFLTGPSLGGPGPRLNCARNPAAMDIGPGCTADMAAGARATTTNLRGGTLRHRSGLITTLNSHGVVDLRLAEENFAPTTWNLIGATRVIVAAGSPFTVKTPDGLDAPFEVVEG